MLGRNLDRGWAMNHREHPPIAIHKLDRHLMNLHLRDIGARMREYVPIGTGVMDFAAIVGPLLDHREMMLRFEYTRHAGQLPSKNQRNPWRCCSSADFNISILRDGR
jgi:sugar phosphate isomerase/epimerase